MDRNLEKVIIKAIKKNGNFRGFFFLVFFYFLLLTFPAQAARLQSWRLDATQTKLEFSTDEGVQPTAQLITDPTRLVIDLPGVRFGRPQVTEPYSGAIRSIRVGQFDQETTRLVVEYAPGYTIDPNQVQFRGASGNEWTVQLPRPQFTANPVPAPTLPQPSPQPPISSNPLPPRGTLPTSTRTQIVGVQATQDGFFLRLNGEQPEVRALRTGDRRQMILDLYGATISPALTLAQRDLIVNRNGVSRFQVTQFQASPPVVRLTLTLSPDSPNWQATPSSFGSLVVIPQTGQTPTPSDRIATIESVELEGNNQLRIRADQPIDYTTGWDRATGAYRILIRSARLDANVRGPQLTGGSPLLQVRLRPENDDVAILLTPAAGVQISVPPPSDRRQAIVSFRRAGLFPGMPTPGTSPQPGQQPIPVPPSPSPMPPPTPVPNGRQVVVLDPGHGGPDPGAIGIGGLRETDIVLDVSRRTQAILERSGVTVIMTRNAEFDLGLQPRVDIANRANASIFVSVHANAISMSRQDISGIETYYHQTGKELAQVLHRNIVQATGAPDRWVRQARFYVLRHTRMPSVLLELGFVTGREDAPRLASSEYRQVLAEAIARGILQYLGRRN